MHINICLENGGIYSNRRDAAYSQGTHKVFLHPKAPKGLLILSCSGIYGDTKTVNIKFVT